MSTKNGLINGLIDENNRMKEILAKVNLYPNLSPELKEDICSILNLHDETTKFKDLVEKLIIRTDQLFYKTKICDINQLFLAMGGDVPEKTIFMTENKLAWIIEQEFKSRFDEIQENFALIRICSLISRFGEMKDKHAGIRAISYLS
jgi:hypothetical protein